MIRQYLVQSDRIAKLCVFLIEADVEMRLRDVGKFVDSTVTSVIFRRQINHNGLANDGVECQRGRRGVEFYR